MQTLANETNCITSKITSLKGEGKKGIDKNNFGKYVMTGYNKAKRTLHKHCTLVDKVTSQQYRWATLKILYTYNWVEQIKTIRATINNESQIPHCQEKKKKKKLWICKGEARNSSVVLDQSEALIQTNVYFIYTSTETNTNVCAYMVHYKHTHFLAPSTKSPSPDTSTTKNTLSTQILISKYHSPVKGTRTPWTNG